MTKKVSFAPEERELVPKPPAQMMTTPLFVWIVTKFAVMNWWKMVTRSADFTTINISETGHVSTWFKCLKTGHHKASVNHPTQPDDQDN